MANDYMDSDAGGSTTTSSTASAGTDHGLLLVWLTIGYILVLAALLYPLTVLVRKVRKYRKSASRNARSVDKEHLDPCGEKTDVSGKIEMGLMLDGAGTSIKYDELDTIYMALPPVS